MAIDNESNHSVGCLFLSILITLIVFILVIGGESVYWLYAIAIIWAIYFNLLNGKKKEKETAAIINDAFDAVAASNHINVLLKEGDFDALKGSMKQLFQLCDEMSRDKVLYRQMKSFVKVHDTGNNEFKTDTFKLMTVLLLAKDAFYCCRHLGIDTELDFNKAGGQAQAALAMFLLEDSRENDYEDFEWTLSHDDEINKSLRKTYNKAYVYYRDQNDVNLTCNGEEDFSLIWMLRAADDERYLPKVREMLNKLARQIANVEGLTPEKEEWLKILENRKANDPADEDDEDPADGSLSDSTPAIEELNGLVGLKKVKAEVTAMKHFIEVNQRREQAGMKTPPISYHCVFTGNPGTGKTTVARIVAGIYKEMGILKKGHLVETDRSGLVAEYVGQTAVKTNKIVDSALDGVLFIDEAYSLADGGNGDYGKEAISTLVKRMEDDRDRLVVILAGYADEIEKFIETNPGLRSRFNRYIHFEDYTEDELMEIYKGMIKKYDFTLLPGAEGVLKNHLKKRVAYRGKDFGNARYIRNLFEHTIKAQAVRLSGLSSTDKTDLSRITAEDIITTITEEDI